MCTVCERCGQSIKNIYVFQGKNYGVECVQIVSGVSSWELGNDVNVDTYLANKAQREATKQAEAQEIENKREHFYSKNKWLIDYLMEKDTKELVRNNVIIKHQEMGFFYNVAQELFYKEIEKLSDKKFEIVVDAWAKDFGGRKGTKKYDKAYDQFFDNAGIE